MNLEGKNIIITGGSSGIGEATAISCAMNGARVGIISRTEERLERVVNNIKDKGGEAEYHVADLVNEEELVSGVKYFIEQWGSVQGLVNNAMSMQTIVLWMQMVVLFRRPPLVRKTLRNQFFSNCEKDSI